MKILIVGPDTESRKGLAAKIAKLYPDAELILADRHPDEEDGVSCTGVWIDECSEIFADFVFTRPAEYVIPVQHSLPAKEKVMHPWSRRKKR